MTRENPTPPADATQKKSAGRRILRFIGNLFLYPAVGIAIFWGTLAIYYSNLPHFLLGIAAVVYAGGSIALLFFMKPRRRGFLAFCVLFFAVLIWWELIPPSNNRNWQRDVMVLPWADISGNQITVHNIRNCNYRSETDYDVRHYDRTFDLDKLRSADLYIVTWGSPEIAHTMMSFGFEGDQYICVSIETRKEVGEDYSTVKGFFKQYEIAYIVADERDLVCLRTNYRKDELAQLYRLKSKPTVIREVFLDYFKTINSLRDRAEWYNALTDNCTTSIRGHTRPFNQSGNKSWNWRFLLNGHLPELLYERGVIDTSIPLAELQKISLINPRAHTAGDGEDFSRIIRTGLPEMSSAP